MATMKIKKGDLVKVIAGKDINNEGKVIAAAFLDAHNQLVVQVRALQAKALPPEVPTKP